MAATPHPPLVSGGLTSLNSPPSDRGTASVRVITGGLYDVQGRLVRRWKGSTSESVAWDGTKMNGSAAPSGVYFLMAEEGATRASTKVVLAR